MITTRTIRDPEELQALEPAWWDLWRRMGATPFQSPAWLLPWWRSFAPGDLLTFAAERNDALLGLAPFYLEDDPHGRLLPLGIGITDYLDVLIHPDHEAEAGRAIADAGTSVGGWDLWECEELRPDAAALTLACPEGVRETLTLQSPCPTLALHAANLPSVVPKKKQRQLSLARNRAARRGGAIIEQADASTLDSSLDHLIRLHGFRWQSRGEGGVLADERVQQFHRLAAPALQAAGLLRLFTLRFGDTVVAAYMASTGAMTLAPTSPVSIRLSRSRVPARCSSLTLSKPPSPSARLFHFLRGSERHKYGWGAIDRWNQRRSFRRTGTRDAAA